MPLASLAKRTSVAKSGEEAVPGDLNIERFCPFPLSSIAASSASQSQIQRASSPSIPRAFKGLSFDSLLAAESELCKESLREFDPGVDGVGGITAGRPTDFTGVASPPLKSCSKDRFSMGSGASGSACEKTGVSSSRFGLLEMNSVWVGLSRAASKSTSRRCERFDDMEGRESMTAGRVILPLA